jgi:D-3-phosphoglycerate dehydrogenase
MSGQPQVLLSAPYMIPVWDQFSGLLVPLGIEMLIADVTERLSEDELLAYAGKVDGVICGDDPFNASVLGQFAPRLKVISKWGTGVDSIDQQAAAELGISVRNTPGAFTQPVSDSVMASILLFARQTARLDRAMKAGRWVKIPGRALSECSLGVIGVGRIGKQVLRKAAGFGMRLLGNDLVDMPEAFLSEVPVAMTDRQSLLGSTDFISLNCDLNPTSRHLIDSEAFNLMQPGAILINTSRGPVVDELALVQALRQGRIAGAALDVFEDEPLPADSPLRDMDNVLLTPHNANSSPSAWEQVHWNTIRNLVEGLGLVFPDTAAGRASTYIDAST